MSDGSASSWLGLAEVAPSTLNSLTDETGNHSGKSWSVVVIQHVSLSEKRSQQSSYENVEGTSRLRDMLTTTVLQVVPSAVLSDGFLTVHPMLYEVLEQSMMKIIASLESERMDPSNDMCESSSVTSPTLVSLAPIPTLTIMSTEKSTIDSHREHRGRSGFWKATVLNQVRDLPVHSRISVCILHVDDDHEEGWDPIFPILDDDYDDGDDKKSSSLLLRISEALAGRYIIEGGVLVVSWMSFAMAVLVVTKVDVMDTDNLEKGGSNDKVYRIGADCDEYTVSLDKGLQPPGILTTSHHGTQSPDQFNSFLEEADCPGYEPLLQELLQHAFLMTTSHMLPLDKYGGAAASGILLTGCAGVGKTRLASCLAHNLRCGDDVARMQVHWVSVHDLILRASHETNLIHYVIPSSITSSTMHESGLSWMIIVDDLHILERSSDSDDTATDMELLLVRNAILQAMDQRPSNCLFLGLGQSAKQLPTEFLRIGRLEKQIVMHPPTQSQRQAIMMKLLASTPQVKSTKTSQPDLLERWVEILAASPTAGCVAADLRRLCTDAFTRALAKQNMDYGSLSSFALIDILSWDDLREAARKCTPSQLAQLDVTKPTAWLIDNPTVLDNIPDETRRRHEESWHRFGGYPEVKNRVYRTVVGPWKRHLDNKTPSDSHSFGIQPPKGVLFHGPSGCGKTLAASCLASSLGLAVVKVRSSDVLDQWLGGSEAILRSLFERARAAAPCILFFDELDAIASNRAVSDQSADVSSRLLSTFLNELDGISSSVSANVLVVACSNRLEALDAALLRPGRLEEHVHLTTPSLSDIHDVLKLCTERVPLNNDVDLFEVASKLSNATGADVEGICREACYVALRRLQESDLVEIRKIDFDEAIRAWK